MNDYWNSPAAARAMHSTGRQLGQREGHQQGHARGYQEGLAAAQSQLDEMNEMLYGLAQILGACAEVLSIATEAQKMQLGRRYLTRVDDALISGILKVAPHQDNRFAGMTITLKLIDESVRACLKNSNNSVSPSL